MEIHKEFFNLVAKLDAMETIVINVENKSKAKHILNAVKLLNGVTNASIASDEDLENISILKACQAARETPRVSKEEVLNALK
ncbi:MAG TPA: hypothetical protein DCL77_20275 [Prolixibacteraceae bacterium]|nr:hypothetical protein [Prolixibacteraceae bacterium]